MFAVAQAEWRCLPFQCYDYFLALRYLQSCDESGYCGEWVKRQEILIRLLFDFRKKKRFNVHWWSFSMICTCPKILQLLTSIIKKKLPVILFSWHQDPERIKPSNKQTLYQHAYVYGPPCSAETNYNISIILKGSSEVEIQGWSLPSPFLMSLTFKISDVLLKTKLHFIIWYCKAIPLL